MKYLVEESTGFVRGGYEQPLKFSISGHFVVDVPSVLGVTPVPAYSDLITAKVAAVQALHPALPGVFSSEFFDGAGSDVVTADSSLFTTGPWKRTSIMAKGTNHGNVITPVLSIGSSITKLYFQCTYFLLGLRPTTGDSPGASDLLYNYDEGIGDFVDSPTGVTATLCDSGGANLATLTPNFEQPFVSGPIDVRVRFRNMNTSGRVFISDFILLYG